MTRFWTGWLVYFKYRPSSSMSFCWFYPLPGMVQAWVPNLCISDWCFTTLFSLWHGECMGKPACTYRDAHLDVFMAWKMHGCKHGWCLGTKSVGCQKSGLQPMPGYSLYNSKFCIDYINFMILHYIMTDIQVPSAAIFLQLDSFFSTPISEVARTPHLIIKDAWLNTMSMKAGSPSG